MPNVDLARDAFFDEIWNRHNRHKDAPCGFFFDGTSSAHRMLFSDALFGHPIRDMNPANATKINSATVYIYPIWVFASMILHAPAGYDFSHLFLPDQNFSVLYNHITKSETAVVVEARVAADKNLLVRATNSRVDASYVNLTRNGGIAKSGAVPIPDFKSMTDFELLMIAVAVLAQFEHIEQTKFSLNRLEANGIKFAEQWAKDDWRAFDEVPEEYAQSMYFLDLVNLTRDAWDYAFTDPAVKNNSNRCRSIPTSHMKSVSKHFSGELVSAYKGNWEPMIAKDSGNPPQYLSGLAGLTIAAACSSFGDYREKAGYPPLTPAETAMIPDEFSITTEVPKEIVRLASLIYSGVNTAHAVHIAMLRGGTGVGKSTGTRMLAKILGMPYLSQTCFPTMETSDFLVNIVPRTSVGGLGLSDSDAKGLGVTSLPSDPSHSPRVLAAFKRLGKLVQMAVGTVGSLSEENRETLLDPKNFIASMKADLIATTKSLLGDSAPNGITEAMLEMIYNKCCVFVNTAPLLAELDARDSTANDEFVSIPAPVATAVSRGYLCELQEADRIIQSGVLTGLNELSRTGGKICTPDGKVITVHPLALLIVTVNYGYTGSRPMEQAFLRRCSQIIDFHELSKEEMFARVRNNIPDITDSILQACYDDWQCVHDFCDHNMITDGSCSVVEFEWYCWSVLNDGEDSMIDYNLYNCLISKATADPENQRAIADSVKSLRENKK